MDMKDVNLKVYCEKVKNYKYYKIVKNIIKILSGDKKTILDIGSADVDLISDYPFAKRVSVSLDGAINNDKVIGYQMDFLDYEVLEKFDVITCLQVVEHVEKAKEFVQKILKSGKLCIISVPYKWEKGICKYHVQDPIDKKKMYSWSETNPLFTFMVKDGSYRMVMLYGKLNFIDYLKIFQMYVFNKIVDFCCNKLFSITKQKYAHSKLRKLIIYILGIKFSFSYKSKPKKRKKSSKNTLISDFEIKRCLEFREQLEQLDLEKDYKILIKNLDADSINTICTVLSRVSKIESQDKYSKEEIFSSHEIEVSNTIKSDFKNKVIKLSDSCYAYYNYYLPMPYFDTSVFYYKYDLNLLKNLEDIKSKCIIDAGAFVGDSALILEQYCDKVYAFEPTSSNYDLLLKTLDLNAKVSKIIPVKKGLGSKEEILKIHIDKGSSSINRVLRDNLETEPIEITTLDKFVEENNLEIGLIKVDIEGFEQDFLKGAENTIKTQKPILLISIYHSAFDFFQIKPYIESLNMGYELKISKNIDDSIRGEILLIAQ